MEHQSPDLVLVMCCPSARAECSRSRAKVGGLAGREGIGLQLLCTEGGGRFDRASPARNTNILLVLFTQAQWHRRWVGPRTRKVNPVVWHVGEW